ncbi:hypothetical protein [Pseudomonas sp. UBA1879]|uniref:hypothetical protein n=1 Tax=Pseudomonas sp. UBA1879 TaxID=1947305 RepID=UPI0025DEA9C0|nr:hypothetical protein [Pseudomonas sp. UBA1879]
MNREEFYRLALSTGWLHNPDMCGGISEGDREIAVKAIAGRATGTPAEAAAQILSGIAALDAGPNKPVVVRWPKGFDEHDSLIKRSEWHASEARRLMENHRFFADRFKGLGGFLSDQGPAPLSESTPHQPDTNAPDA